VDVTIYTIYDHPRDYPEHFVVRAFRVTAEAVVPSDDCWLAQSLTGARVLVPNIAACNLGRLPEDDPAIIESWL